ncbi:hypothetical protein BD289DRAFT_187559 [Coniella lustricola]|uniref:Uncharacterized protein n=1 Tax=Coniella lustricola TaxID=2025994 RepID=A0A2T2ZT05_9PEZI|nr:hypothetical protein BD289DRAFT_187559 [Coniella lustricola]
MGQGGATRDDSRQQGGREKSPQHRTAQHSTHRRADRSIISRHDLDSHAYLRRRGTTQDRRCTFPYQTVTIPPSQRQNNQKKVVRHYCALRCQSKFPQLASPSLPLATLFLFLLRVFRDERLSAQLQISLCCGPQLGFNLNFQPIPSTRPIATWASSRSARLLVRTGQQLVSVLFDSC